MFETEYRINQFLIGYCRTLLTDIPDETLADQPLPGVNHPAWILGHLALSADAAVASLGGTRELPEEWSKLFGPGSTLTTNRADYPASAILLQAVESSYARARGLGESATTEMLERPNSNRILRRGLPTVRDSFAFLLTAHFSLHLGQFSTWRRMIGLAPLF